MSTAKNHAQPSQRRHNRETKCHGSKKSVVRPTVRKSAFMRFISMIRKIITNKRTVEKKGDK